MRVGYYQNNPEFGKVAENVDRIAAKLEDAEADLLVLPELCASGYQFVSMDEVRALAEPIPAGQTTKRLLDLAKRRQMVIVAGVPEQAGTAYYNSAVVVAPQGFIGSYRKTHLFFEETLYFTPGDTGFHVWDIGPAKIGVMICSTGTIPRPQGPWRSKARTSSVIRPISCCRTARIPCRSVVSRIACLQ